MQEWQVGSVGEQPSWLEASVEGRAIAGEISELMLSVTNRSNYEWEDTIIRVELPWDILEARLASRRRGLLGPGETWQVPLKLNVRTGIEGEHSLTLVIRGKASGRRFSQEIRLPITVVLPSPQTTRGRSLSSVPPPGPIQNRWALLVGVNEFVDPVFHSLRFCVNDVLALGQMLQELGYTVVMLHDDASEERLLPTRDNVEAELARICQVAGVDDLIWIHFACHGKLVDGRPVLITREIRQPTLAEKALPLAEVEKRLRKSNARRLILTLDACHIGVEIGRDLADPEFIRNAYELAEGFALLAASTAQQVAQEWEAVKHGVFTYFLLEGLRGAADRDSKGFVTVDDLKKHVLDGLRRWSVEHGGIIQEPTARIEGLGDIILADYRECAVSRKEYRS